jgi:hypothetical protein
MHSRCCRILENPVDVKGGNPLSALIADAQNKRERAERGNMHKVHPARKNAPQLRRTSR